MRLEFLWIPIILYLLAIVFAAIVYLYQKRRGKATEQGQHKRGVPSPSPAYYLLGSLGVNSYCQIGSTHKIFPRIILEHVF